jgi:hypothetical protein
MKLKFIGDYKKLKKCILRTGVKGQWHEPKNGHKQFHAESGAVLNWLKLTGTVWFQGKEPAIPKLKRAFVKVATKKGLLEGAGDADDEITDLRGVIAEIAKLKRWRKRVRVDAAELKRLQKRMRFDIAELKEAVPRN